MEAKADQQLSQAVLAKDLARVKELLAAGGKPNADMVVYAIEFEGSEFWQKSWFKLGSTWTRLIFGGLRR